MIDIKVSYGLKKDLPVKVEFFDKTLNYPLHIYFTKNGKEIWSQKISNPHIWCLLPYGREADIKIIDNLGKLIYNKPWSYNCHSDIVEQKFIQWCESFIFEKNFKPNGIVIGSHDGGYGEWVTAYKKDLIGKTLLIEPNIKPFHELIFRYQHDSRFSYQNSVVSSSDGIVDFFTNKLQNSESSSLIKTNELLIKKQIVSVNPNTLIENTPADWIHIDAEGFDSKIILEIKNENLSNVKFIMWEHIHLDLESNQNIFKKLSNLGYEITKGQGYNSCAIKKD